MATLPVISPEGQFGYIPPENSEAALAKGFKHAIAVVSPEGQDGWIPAENAAAALKKQFKIGTSAQLQAEKGPDSGALDLPNVNKALREGVLGAASAVGLPESTNPQDFNPAPGLKQIFTHPIESAKALGGAIYDAQAEQHELANRAQQAGDTYGALVHGVAAAVPLVGPAAVKSGEEIGRGIQNRDLGQAAHGLGAGAGLVGSLATGTEPGQAATEGLVKGTAAPIIKGGKALAGRTAEAVQNVKQVINPVKYMTAEQAATKAIRPRNAKANFPQELQTALPDAKRAADALQIDPENMTLDDALKAVNQAKKDVWGEYQNNHLDPNVGVTVDTSPVADAMRKTVSKRIAEQNPALAKKVLKNADSYDGRDLSVQDLEDRVRELNNQTRAIEARYVVDKRAAKLNPRNAALFAERDGLRQLLLDKMSETAPAFVGTDPAASAAALRQRYGNLLSVEDSISRRVPVANRQAPKGLTDILRDVYGPAKIAKGLAQIGTGVGALHGLANIIEGGVEMKMANNAKLVNNPDFLIGQAFKKTAARPPAQLRNIIEGEYVTGDHGPFQTPQAASYPGRQLPSGEPVRNELPAGQYQGQPSPLDAIFRPRQPQLQKAPSIPPSRQLPSKGAVPLGPSGSTGANNIEPVRLPWSNAVVAPEGQAIANAVTKGAKPRQFAQPKSSNPLPFLRPSAEAAPVAAPIQQSIKHAGGEFLGSQGGVAYFNVPELGPKSSTLAMPEFSTPEQVKAHVDAALADAKNRPTAKAPKPQPSTPAPNPEDVAMSNRFRLSQLQEALRKSTEPKERAELQSTIEQIKAQLPKRNEGPLLPWQNERRAPLAEAPTNEKATLQQSTQRTNGALPPGHADVIPTNSIKQAPHRFQYKLNTDAEGVGTLLKEQSNYNPDLAGVISVWRDPADGQLYVVNGHHRLELAKRTGQQTVLSRHIVANNATEARAIGALQNIAEGRGTAIDAAKFMRDTGITADELKAKGISMGEAMAAKGHALSALDGSLFNKAVQGDMPLERAVSIGEATPDHAEQRAISELVDRSERKGKKVNNDTLKELVRFVKGSGQSQETTLGLFGSESITKSHALEKAEVSAYVKQQLVKDKKLFGFVSKGERAEELERGNNIIDVKSSKALADEATQGEEVYNKLSERSGPIADVLDDAAARIAGGENPNAVKQEAYANIRTEISSALGGSKAASPQRRSAAREASLGAQDEQSHYRRPAEHGKIEALTDDELTSWAKSRSLKIEEAGEQATLFGGAEKMYRVSRVGSDGERQSALVPASKIDKLRESNARVQKQVSQPSLFSPLAQKRPVLPWLARTQEA